MRTGRGDLQAMCGNLIPGKAPQHLSRATTDPGVVVGVRRAPAVSAAATARKEESARKTVEKTVEEAKARGVVSTLSRGLRLV